MYSTQEFNCIFCKESFEHKEELQIHFRKHGDPKFNQSVKNNKSRTPNESQTSGEGPNEEGEMVSCDVCSDVFPTISKAITHKHKVHPDHDAKYFCPWCGKLFTMKHLYNKHIQTNHDSIEASGETGFHCDYCEVDFFVPSAMVYHNKFFHRQDTELAAIGHSKKLKLFNQELLQIFYCPFCGEEYYNKVNLHKHMGDDHIDEDQSPDDVLRCPLCDAIFYHLDAYELHLTFHSSEDIYSEENERASDVNEFSLETVPPIMEKVENDTQEDAESAMNSLGIEELLQQAMNETNDASNGECVPGKKSKKHKKHKKSKKPAITLDEFLNMNKDVFGDGIDFQGIEEVPEQVVAKQLKGKRAPKPKTATKMLSQDLAKLKKIGIVVKKKSGKNTNQVPGVINKESLKGTPVKVAQNLLKNKTPVTQTTAISTSGEVLSRLLNQSNSQIKIVKKSVHDNSHDCQKPSEDISKATQGNQDDASDKKIEVADTENAIKENDNINDRNSEDHINSMVPMSPKLDDKQKLSQETLSSLSDDKKTDSKFTKENNCTNKGFANENESSNCETVTKSTEYNDGDDNLKEDSQLGKAKTNVTNTLNALRNISQHLTIKSLSSPNNVQCQQRTNSKGYVNDHLASDIDNDERNETTGEKNHDDKSIKEQHENKNSLDALKSSHRMIAKPVNQSENSTIAIALPYFTENKTDTQELPQNEDMNDDEHKEAVRKKIDDSKRIGDQNEYNTNKNSLNALKHLSHLITVKSVNQSKNINTAIALPYITDKTDNQEVLQNKEDINDDECNETFQQNSEDVKSVQYQNENKSNKNSLNALKHLSSLLTVKPVKESKNTTTAIALPYFTKNKTDTQEVPKTEDNQETYHDENREDPKATIEKNNTVTEQTRHKKETPTLDALKNVSKNITIKSLTHQTENTIVDHYSGESNEGMNDDYDEDVDIGVESNKPKTENIIGKKTNFMLTSQPIVTKSVDNLKSTEKRNKPTNPTPKTIKISKTGNKIQTSDKEFKLNDDTAMTKSCTNILKHLPNLTAKPVTVPNTINQKATVQSSTQSINFLKDNIVQKPVKKEINEDIEIFNIDDSDDEEANSQDSSINQFDTKPMIETTKSIDKNKIDKSIALKNLSKHITIKTSNQQKIIVNENESCPKDLQDDVDYYANSHDSDNEDDKTNTLKSNIQKPGEPRNIMKTAKNTAINVGKTNLNKSVDVLKNLSKHITIKSPNQQKIQLNDNLPSPEDMLEDHEADSNDYNNGVKDVNNISKQGVKKQTEPKHRMASLIDTYKSKEALKNLSKNVTIKSSNQQKVQINETMPSPEEDLQDFIDYEPYSDDEDDVTKNISNPIIQRPLNNIPKNVQKTDINREALKNLSKHITIKSSNQQKLSIDKNVESPEDMLDNIDYDAHLHYSDNEVDVTKNILKHVIKKQERRNVIKQGEQRNVVIKQQEEQKNVIVKKQGEQRNIVLQKTLKSLSKNICIKSNNSSPKTPMSQSTKHNVLLDGFDSDSNSNPGNVKITEMSDDNVSDEEFLSQLKNAKNSQTNSNVIVQSPNESNSDNDDYQKQSSEIESKIKLNTVKNSPKSAYLDSLKNISKHITIKSRKDNNLDEDNETEAVSTIQKDIPVVPHLKKEMSLKPFRQTKPDCRDDSDTNKTINRSSTNVKGFTSSNRVNTVNKEVTVKTFQSQTIIEEVTTTVTKTFRTVNQTVKQEVRNVSQSSSAMHVTRPQMIQGIRPNQQIKNVHAIPVRQSTPTMGPRIRNTLTPTRPAICARAVRPSNQLVPTRPSLNIARPSNPRMPVVRKIQTPTSSSQKPLTGKPLKISPNAIMPSVKRPSEDSSGHFSCFKKPKESLIPIADVPVFSSKQESGSVVHYSSSSNISRSNFTSTTKIVKGNSVVTSTQAKLEVNSNSEQLSKLGNVSGLKIMKTSQTKQAIQVEDQCEISASKRTALEAIDKLQKSGLLVKKPRIEEDRYSEHSNSDFDDNFET